MADKMIRMAGRSNDGKARAIKTDVSGNIGTQLSSRNELITWATDTVPSKGTKSVVNRFSNLKDYSAIVVAVAFPSSVTFTLTANWYIQKNGETNGTQVTSERLAESMTSQRLSSNYLEIRGTQLSVVIGNAEDVAIEATVFVMGIR